MVSYDVLHHTTTSVRAGPTRQAGRSQVPTSKTDQFGKGATVTIYSRGHSILQHLYAPGQHGKLVDHKFRQARLTSLAREQLLRSTLGGTPPAPQQPQHTLAGHLESSSQIVRLSRPALKNHRRSARGLKIGTATAAAVAPLRRPTRQIAQQELSAIRGTGDKLGRRRRMKVWWSLTFLSLSLSLSLSLYLSISLSLPLFASI